MKCKFFQRHGYFEQVSTVVTVSDCYGHDKRDGTIGLHEPMSFPLSKIVNKDGEKEKRERVFDKVKFCDGPEVAH